MLLFYSVFPIALLIYLMTKKNSVPSKIALPSIALLTYLISLVLLKQNPIEVHAAVIDGLLTAMTPLTIIAGAVFLFKTMEITGSLDVIRKWLNGITSNKVGQLMIVGWAFAFLIEGASGFGTPAALAAPILVGLGFSPVRAAVFTLILNSVPVSFGAVGTPTWFGFSALGNLSRGEILEIGIKSAAIHSIAALIIPIIALTVIIDRKTIWKNLGFIYLSILSTIIPYFLISFVNYEFPSLLGGFIGLMVSIGAARREVGMKKSNTIEKADSVPSQMLIKSLFPIWGTILVLMVTRIPALKIKALLISKITLLEIEAGTLGRLSLSKSLIFELKGIFGTGASADYKLLYVPGIIPFVMVALITYLIFKKDRATLKVAFTETAVQMEAPLKALLGSLVFVNLIMMGGDRAPTMIIGRALSESLGWGWQFFAPYLGAVGSFFSGSNTVSNLTFGAIQDSIASELNLNRTSVLAAQSVGGAMGNMVCINNIVAVCSVLGLSRKEGEILKKTIIPMTVYGIIAGLASIIIT